MFFLISVNLDMANSKRFSELPVDKEYHLFVCYTKENGTEVQEIVKYLENEGVKCCYHERDFVPGQRVLDSIHVNITKSMHMLVVLSVDFTNSNFCEHEVMLALQEKIEAGYSIIPIKIEACSVPINLRHLTYIEAEDETLDNMHTRIIDTMLKSGRFVH